MTVSTIVSGENPPVPTLIPGVLERNPEVTGPLRKLACCLWDDDPVCTTFASGRSQTTDPPSGDC
jgi:hypothetical protein